MKYFMSVAFVLFSVIQSFSFERDPTPLGLSFGMSEDDVTSLGVVILERMDERVGTAIAVGNVPRPVSDMENVFLSFDASGGLSRVLQMSKTYANDKFGIFSIEKFNSLSASLTEIYGPGDTRNVSPKSEFLLQDDNFAYSIDQKERAHSTWWNNGRFEIVLMIGSKFEDTFIILSYTDIKRQGEIDDLSASSDKDGM